MSSANIWTHLTQYLSLLEAQTPSTGIVRGDVCSNKNVTMASANHACRKSRLPGIFSRRRQGLMAAGTMFTRTINVNLALSMKINENIFF